MASMCSWDVQENENHWTVSLTSQEGDSPEKLEAEFKNTLIDYSLREKIRSETEQIRALLFAHAFSNVTNSQ